MAALIERRYGKLAHYRRDCLLARNVPQRYNSASRLGNAIRSTAGDWRGLRIAGCYNSSSGLGRMGKAVTSWGLVSGL
jgi:hypothetical protein